MSAVALESSPPPLRHTGSPACLFTRRFRFSTSVKRSRRVPRARPPTPLAGEPAYTAQLSPVFPAGLERISEGSRVINPAPQAARRLSYRESPTSGLALRSGTDRARPHSGAGLPLTPDRTPTPALHAAPNRRTVQWAVVGARRAERAQPPAARKLNVTEAPRCRTLGAASSRLNSTLWRCAGFSHVGRSSIGSC